MKSPADSVRDAIGAYLSADAAARRARATAGDAAEPERALTRARRALGTGEVRERLEEAVSTRGVETASHGALLAHLARAAEAEVLARRGVTLEIAAEERVVVGDRERSLRELAMDTRSAPAEVARAALAALADHVARGREARLEALAEAAEQRAKVLARGPAIADIPSAEFAAECERFLDATDDAAEDLVARAHHAAQVTGGSLVARLRALTSPALDAIASPRNRSRRAGEAFRALGLDRELTQRVAIVSGRSLGGSLAIERGRATVIASALELGVVTERTLFGAVATALTHALASPVLHVEHAHAPVGSAARAIGALFEAWLADPAFVARHFEVGPREARLVAVASAATLTLTARHACVLAQPGASVGSDRERVGRALVLDPGEVSPELARPSLASAWETLTGARARLAALAWAPALRERYDVDFFRNPRLSDFVRGAAARGGLVGAEALSAELGTLPERAGQRVIELAEQAGH